MNNSEEVPKIAVEAAFKSSINLPESTPKVEGYDFSRGIDCEAILQSLATTGFQASNYGRAVEHVNKMVWYHIPNAYTET